MDRTSEAVVFVDSENNIRHWNRAAELLLDLTPGEFPEHDSVRQCVIPTPLDLERLRAGGSAQVSESIATNRPVDLQKNFGRVIQVIEIDGDPWLLVRLSADPLQRHSESELYVQAHTDYLSNLLNRRGFQSTLEEKVHRKLALAIIDVDLFKQINDNQGHETGDRAIQWLANRLTDSFPDAICIGRLGGDEFGVVLEVSNQVEIERRFNEFCEQVGSDPIGRSPERITISIGVAISKSPGVSARDLLTKADRAMYQSKQAGRNGTTTVDV